MNILSNDEHTLLVTANGEGYSKKDNIYLYKFNENQKFGNITYIKNVAENEFWSNARGPCSKEPDEYQAEFSNSDSFFYRKDGNIETYIVYLADNGETRSIQTTLNFVETFEDPQVGQ